MSSVSGKTYKVTSQQVFPPFKKTVKTVTERTTRKPVVKPKPTPKLTIKPKMGNR